MNPVLPQSRLSTDPLFCLEIVKITISKNIYYWGFENSLNTREGKWGNANNFFVPALTAALVLHVSNTSVLKEK